MHTYLLNTIVSACEKEFWLQRTLWYQSLFISAFPLVVSVVPFTLSTLRKYLFVVFCIAFILIPSLVNLLWIYSNLESKQKNTSDPVVTLCLLKIPSLCQFNLVLPQIPVAPPLSSFILLFFIIIQFWITFMKSSGTTLEELLF